MDIHICMDFMHDANGSGRYFPPLFLDLVAHVTNTIADTSRERARQSKW